MTQVGESVSTANEMQKDKCVVCSKSHDDPKSEKIKQTGEKFDKWRRSESMSDVKDDAKNSLYPNGEQNVEPYPTAGHHCIAFSSFVTDGEDVFARVNHFLNKKEFRPNDAKNIIHLPRNKASLVNFIKSGKPLQPHTGKHPPVYFNHCSTLVKLAARLAVPPSDEICKETDLSTYEDNLKKLFGQAVNYACVQIVEYAPKWNVQKKSTYEEYIKDYTPPPDLPKHPWQTIPLDCGPFKKR